jgi:hypothetical protein
LLHLLCVIHYHSHLRPIAVMPSILLETPPIPHISPCE